MLGRKYNGRSAKTMKMSKKAFAKKADSLEKAGKSKEAAKFRGFAKGAGRAARRYDLKAKK
jgi:hypothetical protein